MILVDAVENFIRFLKSEKKSQSTITAYSNDLDQLSKFTGEVNCKYLNVKHLEDFLASLVEKDYSNKTISRKLNSIKSFTRYLTSQKLIKADISKDIPYPETKLKLPRFLDEAEYRRLRDHAKSNVRLHAIIELMLQTGMRISEVSRLKIENIHLESNPGQILIREYASNPMRVIDLTPVAKECMEKYLSTRGTVKNDKGYVFNTRNGSSMLIRNIRSALNRIFRKAKVTKATVNDLRNTFIVHQLESGVGITKVAQIVGHKRISSTENYLPLLKRKKLGRKTKLTEL